MALTFKKATKTQSKLRLSIAGPAGAGKTFTALKVATEMAAILGGKIAVIDTERGSASKYSDQFEFDVVELDDFHPESYIEAMKAAEKAGYGFLIIDSTSHEWNGKNGILELHEAAIQRQRVKNSFTAWADVTPLHTKFIDAILSSKCHVIASVRSKVDYVQDKNDKGQTEVRKVGMASIQREGMDYEYDIQIEMNLDHVGVISKTRCAKLDGKIFKKPGAELAQILVEWLSDGAEPAQPPAVDPDYLQTRAEILTDLGNIYMAQGRTMEQWCDYRDANGLTKKSNEDLELTLESWQKRAADKAKAAEQPKEEAVTV